MGSEYFPAPTAPTRILGPDAVPLSGDVSLLPGNGAGIVRSGNGLLVATNPLATVRAVPAFAPGAAVARSLQKATVKTPTVSAIDIFLGTAAAGVTGSNIANVQVAGSVSGGPIVVPLAAGVSEFHLGVHDLTTTLAGQDGSGSFGAGTTNAIAIPFQVSTNTTVFNADISITTPNTNVNGVRCGIATGVTAATPVLTPNWIVNTNGVACNVDMNASDFLATNRPVFQFPGSVGFVLVPGTTYWLVLSNLSQHAETGQNKYAQAANLNGTNLGNLVNPNVPRTNTLDGFLGLYSSTFDNSLGAIWHITFALYGAVMGTPLTGLVVVSQTITGAPPGTTGSDANIVVQC